MSMTKKDFMALGDLIEDTTVMPNNGKQETGEHVFDTSTD